MLGFLLACGPGPGTGGTEDTAAELLAATCTEEETYVGDLDLETDEEKAEFAERYRCIDGVLAIRGDPMGTLDRLISADDVRVVDPKTDIGFPRYLSGSLFLRSDGQQIQVAAPLWQGGEVLFFYGDGSVHLQAKRVQALGTLAATGLASEDAPHCADLPTLGSLDRVVLYTHLDGISLSSIVGPLQELSLSLYHADSEYLSLPAQTISITPSTDLDHQDISALCGNIATTLILKDGGINTGGECILDLPLRELDSRATLPVLRGSVNWADGAQIHINAPGKSFRRARFAGVTELDLKIEDAEGLYELELPDLTAGTLDIDGHPDLVVDLPELVQMDQITVSMGSVSAPKLEQVGYLRVRGTVEELQSLTTAGTLYIRDHQGEDLSALSALRQADTLEIVTAPNLTDLSHLHGIESLGALTIARTACSDTEIQALLDAIGEENIGTIYLYNNGG